MFWVEHAFAAMNAEGKAREQAERRAAKRR